jgi:predicted DNA-binding protein YlxM (UPF0122 family)
LYDSSEGNQAQREEGEVMEKIFEQALLYDFYGDLLTEHQKQIYEAAVFNDMSLGEIAAEQGISRQGVHDLIKRCDKILSEYEEKLHLAERFATAKKKISQIDSLTRLEEKTATDPEASADLVKRLGEIRSLTKELLDTL